MEAGGGQRRDSQCEVWPQHVRCGLQPLPLRGARRHGHRRETAERPVQVRLRDIHLESGPQLRQPPLSSLLPQHGGGHLWNSLRVRRLPGSRQTGRPPPAGHQDWALVAAAQWGDGGPGRNPASPGSGRQLAVRGGRFRWAGDGRHPQVRYRQQDLEQGGAGCRRLS